MPAALEVTAFSTGLGLTDTAGEAYTGGKTMGLRASAAELPWRPCR